MKSLKIVKRNDPRYAMNRITLAAWILVWSSSVLAGAWDTGSFDNDDALDWVWELSESDDLSAVENAVSAAANASDYLEAPTASMAIAAAEVIAALKGNPGPNLPQEVAEWVQANQIAVGEGVLKAARKAIENIKNVEMSELAQLWSKSADLSEVWRADLDDLLQRLE